MSINLRFDETHIPIRVDLTDWLTAYGLDITTRTDAIWLVKSDAADVDELALYQGDESGGGVQFSGTTALLYLLDFSGLAIAKTYPFGFGLKFPGDARFREIRLADSKIFIEPDFIRG